MCQWLIMVLLLVVAGGSRATAVSQATSGEVAEVQAFLKNRRLYDGKVNGLVDRETEAAVRRYQMMHRLRPSGRLDEETQGRISVEKLFPAFVEADRRFLETMKEPSPPPAIGEKRP